MNERSLWSGGAMDSGWGVFGRCITLPRRKPALGSRRREEAERTANQRIPPPYVVGYGSGVHVANFVWEDFHRGPIQIGKGESCEAWRRSKCVPPRTLPHQVLILKLCRP